MLIAGVVAWFQLRSQSADQDSAAAAECVSGPATLAVTVDPSIADQVSTLAERYNATKPRVRDYCAQVAVTAQPSSAIVAAFVSGKPWDDAALGPQPALWIPDSTRSVESMRVPGLIEGAPTPIATSPIMLGVPEDLRAALDTAKIGWSDLPQLQQGTLDELGLSGWGGLRMTLPDGDGSLTAATQVGSAVSGAEPLDAKAAQSGQVIAAISGLAAEAPESENTDAALDTIANARQPQGAPIHAVAATEQQIVSHPGVAMFTPAGPQVLADHPAALMSGPWVDRTQNLMAGMFADYLRAPEQTEEFTDAGFAAPPATAPATPPRQALDKVRATLANPVLGVRSTVLVDVSSSMATADGATTRLTNTVAALGSTLSVMPPDFGLGLWTFGKNLDGNTPYQVQAATAPLTDTQRSKITTALGSVHAGELQADQVYPSLLAAVRDASKNYTPGLTNSILVITDGPEDDSALTGAQLTDQVAAAITPEHPIRIDVVVIGAGGGAQTLKGIADRTAGSYTVVPSTDDIAFGSAVVKAMTTP
ncbi:substrate-binding domain-containing protein [Nocardia callitridis]|uniref:Substrate-binding domain-containing protein n=1 Tax=Nocardia callitridis TaxID=648753 RepID=A0ABP9K578_9NOCA